MNNEEIKNAKIIGFCGFGGSETTLPHYLFIQIELDGKRYDIKSSGKKMILIPIDTSRSNLISRLSYLHGDMDNHENHRKE